ncbi:MAG TPA: dihydrolipoyl dehydrogenase [Vicinamibacterales bacterium]|jgi:dihydrolipoamide dehydrogenase|nr:dihydrolipoyl dehydrogenase [Vicinamibacterales bacterium]
MTNSTQLAVIGGGPGGYAAAFLAADLGMQVTLIDEAGHPGGVCLYRGCMPSKTLLHVAKVLTDAREARAWGVDFGEPSVDLDRLRSWKDGVVGKLTGGLGQLSSQRGVTYLRGRGELVGSTAARVTAQDGHTTDLQFEHAILATGSRPASPPALSLESDRVWDSTRALDVPAVPSSLLVVGGGYIGLELASVYAALGSAVTVVEMTPGLLPGADRDLISVVARRLEVVCEAVLLETTVAGLAEEADGVSVTLQGAGGDQSDQRFDRVLVAVGRVPNSDIPGLERTGVQRDARGFVVVDGQRRTAEPTIFAVGDVVGEPMLAHKASHEARTAVEAIAGHKTEFHPAAIPAVVFTDPEVAWCGLTEAQAKSEARMVQVCRYPWAASGRAVTLDRPAGVTKLIVDPESEQLLGVGIAGTGAGELIAEGVVAIEMGATVSDLRLCIHPHPTLSETLMESAEVFFGQSTHVYRPKRPR